MLRASAIGALLMAIGPGFAQLLSPVADAAQRGDVEEVRTLLRGGADVNAAQGDGMTALHWASLNGDAAMVGALLTAGASLEPTTRLGAFTPLHLAAKNARSEVVEALVAAGSSPDRPTATGIAPLHYSATADDEPSVAALLAGGADPDTREWTRERTPLMFAAAVGATAAMKQLIEAGAEVDATTRMVDYAARSREDGRAEQLRNRLVAARRAANEGVAAQPEAVTERGQSLADASAALLQGRDESPPAGSSEGREARETPSTPSERPLGFADLVGEQGGLTALHYAARDGRIEALELLLASGAAIDRQTLGDGSTALLIATINGNYDLALRLLERGADPNFVSEDGAGPLFATLNNRWAPKALYPQPTAFKQQETDYLGMMSALLAAGADPNQRLQTHIWYTSYNFDLLGVNFRGATPFWRAAYATDVPAMRLLVEHGADPGTPTQKAPARRRGTQGDDPSGLAPVPIGGPAVYPIHAASGVGYGTARAGNSHRHAPEGWLPAVKYLVEELGADVNVRDHDGYSAVHNAAARGDNELIEYLVSQGADVTFVSRRGQTTVDMANGPQQRVQPFPETIALLEGLGAENNHNCLSC
jgi:ankyrin repeat protein